MENVATMSLICIFSFVFVFVFVFLLPVEALLVKQGEGGDHEGNRTGDDEDATDGAHAARHLTQA